MCYSDCPAPLGKDRAPGELIEITGCYDRLPNKTEPAMVITAFSNKGDCTSQMQAPV